MTKYSPAQAWMRAIELTAPIARRPDRILPAVIDERAAESGDAPALLSRDRHDLRQSAGREACGAAGECMTYRELAERSDRYARWALAQGVGKGDCVALLMPNRPEYLAIWLGITKVGGVVALLNTNLVGPSLAHCIQVVSPRHVIVDARLREGVSAALSDLAGGPRIWLDRDIQLSGGGPLAESERRCVTIEDPALYIYTSGTTGLPKAAKISHGRVMQSSLWFAGMMNVQPGDRMYNCLPMYHTVGGLQVPGALLASGGSVVIREKFSANQFWDEVAEWDCTLIQYIGELCRYLLRTEPGAHDTAHRVRMACGNGLARDIWTAFQERFGIPRILEFYGATEGNLSLFNTDGEPGALGRIPPYLAHRFPAALVRLDETGEPMRNAEGLCIPCAVDEAGEAVGKILGDRSNIGSRFDGYTDAAASERKMLRDVLEPGDAWFRTGDLMRKDKRGFFYFVDRIGDTFRWKGENVATCEVAEAIRAFPGVTEADVYGVAIPGADGRAGMATLVAGEELDLTGLRAHLNRRLPDYARPLFLRLRKSMDLTGTFKYTKSGLTREGFNPAATADAIYFNHPRREAFVRVDQALYERIQEGLER